MSGPRATAELIRTLDEKYVADSIAFEAMVAAATLIVEGGSLRSADGSIDLDGIRGHLDAMTWRVPAMRQRLVPTPLRLTTPAWVPVTDLDMAYHVTLHPDIEPDDPGRVEALTGRVDGRMDPARPLWNLRIVELDSGRVAVVARFHHVMGDALFGLRIGEVIAGTEMSSSTIEITDLERAAVGVAPRTGFGILSIAARTWWRAQRGLGGAWHEYWRKPFSKRLRRWGGRVIRPMRNAVIARSGQVERTLVPRHSRYLELEFGPATRRAYKLGGTVNDLLIAATLRAVAELEPARDTVSLLVPISRRTSADAHVRNHISIVKVTVPAGAPLEETVPLVGNQVRAAVEDRSRGPLGERDWSGYATSMTWGRELRYFGGAPIETVAGWPAGDPRDDIACLACSYRTKLTIAITTRATTDIDRLVASVAASFSATPVTAG
jgi:diacylglycerol O-acyltransferase